MADKTKCKHCGAPLPIQNVWEEKRYCDQECFIAARKARRQYPERDAQIVALLREGKTQTEVARAFGLSGTRVWCLAQLYQIPGRVGRPRSRG